MSKNKPKRRKKSSTPPPPPPTTESFAKESTTSVGDWFRRRGVRETYESIIVAILLALMFRSFEAEAYIIPTGSMANNLQGRHIDIACPQCNFQIRAGASSEDPKRGLINPVSKITCPICQYVTTLEKDQREHRSYSGDRILVNKYIYDFCNPERFDVIVFKNPNNGKQNYIKRLIGLPTEAVVIEYGDIYTYHHADESFIDRRIARKTPFRLWHMLQYVDDTDHIAPKLIEADWPSRWDQWSQKDGDGNWTYEYVDGKPVFEVDGSSDDTRMLRYRHLIPRSDGEKTVGDWDDIEKGVLPERYRNGAPEGELIADYYAYNDYRLRKVSEHAPGIGYSGFHWVGDLAVRAHAEIESNSGELVLDLVEGGVHFTCTIDVSSGKATLSRSDDVVEFVDDSGKVIATPTGDTKIKKPGKYEITFANCDDQLYLWIDGKHVEIDGSTYMRSGPVNPKWTPEDPLDAEPLGIGSNGVEMKISRLEVLRDIYYTSVKRDQSFNLRTNIEYRNLGSIFDVEDFVGLRGPDGGTAAYFALDDLRLLFQSPRKWDCSFSEKLFASRARTEPFAFKLQEDQFFPMGDNSPASLDARVWDGPHKLDRSFLLGKALFIYWPHAKSKPIPFFPHFERMKYIR